MADNREVVPAEKKPAERDELTRRAEPGAAESRGGGSRDLAERDTRSEAQRAEAHVSLRSMGAMLTGRRWRMTARWIGLGIFVAGASLLVFVFIQAMRGFSKMSQSGYIQGEVNKIAGDGVQQTVTAYVSVLGVEMLRLFYLLLLGLLGSLIAGKGIQFFSASESVIDEAVIGIDDDVTALSRDL